MNEDWPMPGHKFWYRTQIKLDSGRRLAFDMTIPNALDSWDLSTLRIGRHGGVSTDDALFRSRLYERIGGVTVAGGQVETAMKRLVLLLRGQSGQFSVVDWKWTDLHEALVSESQRTDRDARRRRLHRVLAWGQTKEVKRRRDNVVHAAWWNFDGLGVVGSRFYRKTDGTMIFSSLEDLEDDAYVLFEYARRLDDLLGEDWPRAMLPGAPGASA